MVTGDVDSWWLRGGGGVMDWGEGGGLVIDEARNTAHNRSGSDCAPMLGQRRRCWPTIGPQLEQHYSGIDPLLGQHYFSIDPLLGQRLH